jgi:membrane-associated protein
MIITEVFNLFLHLDKYLTELIPVYGVLIYPIIFVIIFCETGLVFTPILPGDSLIFLAGTLASQNLLNIWILYFLLMLAAILGDTINYFVGRAIGPKVFCQKTGLCKKEYLIKTREFYEKHGGKTIILARFIPIIRTFAPFIAGIGKMNYKRFLTYNVFGGTLWVTLFLFSGYFFGQLDFVKNNLTFVILLVIFISILPAIYEYLRVKLKR